MSAQEFHSARMELSILRRCKKAVQRGDFCLPFVEFYGGNYAVFSTITGLSL